MNNIEGISLNCVGCRSCEQVCPVNAIVMTENAEGFLYPFIDYSKCIECGKCLKHCPQNTQYESSSQSAYGVKLKDRKSLLSSASGGAFYGIAKTVLEKNSGIIYGACYGENLKVKHLAVRKLTDLYKTQSSKYVQSDTVNTYGEIRDLLNNGNCVLFSGTPCQVAGLKSFLSLEYENLFTVDIVCHGVPSPKLFSSFIKSIEEKEKSKVIQWDFRSKRKKGWGTYYYYYYCENGVAKTNPLSFTRFGTDFLKGQNYRECCYRCKYANLNNRPADITICDFWGLMSVNSDFYSNDGVSGVIVNSDKGRKLFEEAKFEFDLFECSPLDIAKNQDNLKASSKRTDKRDCYYQNIDDDYFKQSFSVSFRERLLNILPKKFIIFLKRVKGKLKKIK